MRTPIVKPVMSPQGNFLKNQYVIETENGKFFQSYNDVIAYVPNLPCLPTLVDVKKMEFSISTQKQTENFLGKTLEQVLFLIEDGKILNQELN